MEVSAGSIINTAILVFLVFIALELVTRQGILIIPSAVWILIEILLGLLIVAFLFTIITMVVVFLIAILD